MNFCSAALFQLQASPSLLIQRTPWPFSFDKAYLLSILLIPAQLQYFSTISSHPILSASPGSLAPLMHLRYLFSRDGRWTTSNLVLLSKVPIHSCTFKRGHSFFVDQRSSRPCLPLSLVQSKGVHQGEQLLWTDGIPQRVCWNLLPLNRAKNNFILSKRKKNEFIWE